MNISSRLKRSISHLFYGSQLYNGSVDKSELLYKSSMGSMLKYTITSRNNQELPICCVSSFLTMAYSANHAYITGYLPMTSKQEVRFYRTASMLFNRLMSESPSYNGVLTKAASIKNELYYGAPGIIMDSHKEPLLVTAVKCNIDGRSVTVNECKVYLNPKILNSNGTIEKFIMDKILPYISSYGIYVNIPDRNFVYTRYELDGMNGSLCKPDIIISKSINDFFTFADTKINSAEAELIDNFNRFINFVTHN